MCHIISLPTSTISIHVTNTVSQTQEKKFYAFPTPEKCHSFDTQIPHETQGCDCQSFVEMKSQGCTN